MEVFSVASNECPGLQTTTEKVLLRGELHIAVSRARMASPVVEIFVQPKAEVSTEIREWVQSKLDEKVFSIRG